MQRLRQDKTEEECSAIFSQLRCQIGFIRGNRPNLPGCKPYQEKPAARFRGNRPKLKCFQDIMIEHADDFLNKGIGIRKRGC